jgi:hypothetical protein
MLHSRLRADIRVYMSAVRSLEAAALRTGDDPGFAMALRDVNVSRRAFIESRKKLNEHVAGHGCL